MTRKIVKLAVIKPVSIRELQVGDFIIYDNIKIEVKKINYQDKTVATEEPELYLGFSTYYKVLHSNEERPDTICQGCGEVIKSLTDNYYEFCSTTCKDEYDKAVLTGEIYG